MTNLVLGFASGVQLSFRFSFVSSVVGLSPVGGFCYVMFSIMSPVVGYIFGFRVCVPCSVVSLVSGLSPVVSFVSGCQFCVRCSGLCLVVDAAYGFRLCLRLCVASPAAGLSVYGLCLCLWIRFVSGCRFYLQCSGSSSVVGFVYVFQLCLRLSVVSPVVRQPLVVK